MGVEEFLDPVTGKPLPLKGLNGSVIITELADGAVIQPDDAIVYDPPIQVWIGDAGVATVTVVPYGRQGDASVQYPTFQGMRVPVMAKQVLGTGTTAFILRGQQVYTGTVVPLVPTADSTLITADTTVVTADRS